jgi:DNA polymerase
MLIGEAPGRNEDLGGSPFIGAAGRLLDEALAAVTLTRDDLYITNIVKCRPPQNRNPQADEIAACQRWAYAQIEAIDPRVIVTLGNVSSRWLLATAEPISALRGKVFDVDGRFVIPTFHPAAAIYDSSKREPLFEDLRRVRGLSL